MQEQEMHHDPGEAKRLYVIVRADIPTGYQMAQSCHAAAAIGANQPENLDRYPTIVILNAADLVELTDLRSEILFKNGVGCCPVAFFEPDLNNEMTAFAVFSDGADFRHLDLAGGGEKPKQARKKRSLLDYLSGRFR